MNNRFKRAPAGPILSQEARDRQGRAVRAAQAALGDIEAVRGFLNSPHAGLGGRPLDVAVASDAGLAAVEAVLGDRRRKAPPPRYARSPSPANSGEELS